MRDLNRITKRSFQGLTNRLAILGMLLFLVIVLLLSVLIATGTDQHSFLRHERMQNLFTKRNVPPSTQSFPIGVNPTSKTITEDPAVDQFFTDNLASAPLDRRSHTGWVGRVLGTLARSALYQNLASPIQRTLIIQSGERREEVAKNFSDILGWSSVQRAAFLEAVSSDTPPLVEGKFYPGKYTAPKGSLPEEVSPLVTERFTQEVLSRYDERVSSLVPLEDALIIASLLEREAYDFEDMRQISGVIWNRLFIDMPLQIDATLQYAKGSKPTEPWWPRVVPNDKFIDSSFNTYAHKGLPPAPISNPSSDAILAALNPRKTDCLFYFHDRRGGFHCTSTYEEHVELLKQHYGRGK